jgi:LPXTG-motif cell wall-anchored protein
MRQSSLVLIAAVLILCAAPLHAQFITNGTLDFDANGWSLGGGCGDEQWNGSAGNPPGSIQLNSCGEPDADPTAAQTINGLTVGAIYTIKVGVQLRDNVSGGGTGKSFGIFLDNEPGNPLLITEFLDSSWHTLSVKFTATSTSATIIFAGELDPRTPGGPGVSTDVSYFIDNISVTQNVAGGAIPTLSEQALLLLGIVLAASAAIILRKRRSSHRASRN